MKGWVRNVLEGKVPFHTVHLPCGLCGTSLPKGCAPQKVYCEDCHGVMARWRWRECKRAKRQGRPTEQLAVMKELRRVMWREKK
jgi:hypothetical protein